MKRTKRKDILRTIQKQIVSFISVVVIALLGVTVYLGLDFSAVGIRKNALGFYERQSFRDIEMISTLLFTPGDLEDIRGTEGVSDAEPVWQVSAKASNGGEQTDVYVSSLTERISRPELAEGRMPQNGTECAAEQTIADRMGWEIGDEILLQNQEGATVQYLTGERFTLTGTVQHPDHANRIATDTYYVLLLPEAFDQETLEGCFMRSWVLTDRPAGVGRLSKSYQETVTAVTERLEALALTDAARRDTGVYDQFREQIDAEQEKLNAAHAELEEARRQLDEGWSQYRDGERELADGRRQLEEAKRELEESWAQLEAGRVQLNESEIELLKAERTLRNGKAELEEAAAELREGKARLEDGWEQLEDVKEKFRSGVRNAVEGILGGSSSSLVSWAGRMECRADSADATAMYVYIANGRKIDLNLTLAENLSLAVSVVPDSLLMKAYHLWCDYKGYEPTETDPAEVRAMLGEKAASRMGEFAERYNQARDACLQWDEGHREYLKGLSAYNDGLAEYNKGLARYNDGKSRYNIGYDSYAKGLKQYQEGLAAYEQGLLDAEAGEQKLRESRQELEKGEEQYQEGLARFETGTKQIRDARARLEELEPCRWLILDVNGNPSFVQFQSAAQDLEDMKGTFAVMFLLVGALVIFATVSKMVDDQRRLVGTMKALGFIRREIMEKYLLFGVLATVLGVILGILLSRFFLEPMVLNGYRTFYVFDVTVPTIVWNTAALTLLIGVLLSAAAVWMACHRLLRTPAIRLLQEQVPEGMKKGAGGNSLTLYSRLILRNIRSDFRRVFVTVISVAGCCALVVTGVSIKTSMLESLDKQFNGIVDYDWRLSFSPEESDTVQEEMEEILRSASAAYVPLYYTNVTYQVTDLQIAELQVTDIDRLNDFYHLRDWRTGERLNATDEGLLIQRRVAEMYDLDRGSELTISIGGTREVPLKVAGIFEHFVGRPMVMSIPCYEMSVGQEVRPNAFLVRLEGADADALRDALQAVRGFESITPSDLAKTTFEQATGVINKVVILFIVMSAVMAGVVLMNLTNIYVMQKKRELTILRVNGFTVRETIGYLVRETVCTTFLGILLGLGLGTRVGRIVTGALEESYLQFGRSISIIGWVSGAGLTILFTVLVNVIALRPVKNLKLTDIR